MTVYDVLASAHGGEAQTDEIGDEATQTLYVEYVNEGMRRIWRAIDPIDDGRTARNQPGKVPGAYDKAGLGDIRRAGIRRAGRLCDVANAGHGQPE